MSPKRKLNIVELFSKKLKNNENEEYVPLNFENFIRKNEHESEPYYYSDSDDAESKDEVNSKDDDSEDDDSEDDDSEDDDSDSKENLRKFFKLLKQAEKVIDKNHRIYPKDPVTRKRCESFYCEKPLPVYPCKPSMPVMVFSKLNEKNDSISGSRSSNRTNSTSSSVSPDDENEAQNKN